VTGASKNDRRVGGNDRRVGGNDRRVGGDHYSYEHYRSRDVAEGFDALRFGGPIGRLIQDTQQALLLRALAPIKGRRVLDVGTGTGRAALAFAREGAIVTGVDASAEMLAVAERHAAEEGLAATFRVGDAHQLPFADREFDAAVSLRVIMHTPNWRQCVSELCRVSNARIVVDFPALGSFATIESILRRVRKSMGGNVEAYRTLRESAVREVLAASGFRVVETHRQFVLPINFHKLFNSTLFTTSIEGSFEAIGVLRLLGSPVTMVAER
jgi:ubiquinone/menaquinone biosynthesis C-methylase UbiE